VRTKIIYPLVPSKIEAIFFNTFIDCSIGKLVTLQTILFGEGTDVEIFFVYSGDALFLADPYKNIIFLRNAGYGSFWPKIAESRELFVLIRMRVIAINAVAGTYPYPVFTVFKYAINTVVT